MGATNPANADEGTIRKEFGQSIERNASHGSANLADAAREVTFFFPQAELLQGSALQTWKKARASARALCLFGDTSPSPEPP